MEGYCMRQILVFNATNTVVTDIECNIRIDRLPLARAISFPLVRTTTRFLDRSISAFQFISRNSEGHVESVQPIKCMIFILICNKP
jgi:hypothetical protein